MMVIRHVKVLRVAKSGSVKKAKVGAIALLRSFVIASPSRRKLIQVFKAQEERSHVEVLGNMLTMRWKGSSGYIGPVRKPGISRDQ